MTTFTELFFTLGLLSGLVSFQDAPNSTEVLLGTAKQIYVQEGPKAALPKFEEILKIFQSDKDRHGEAITLGYMANCYRKLEDLDKALQFARQALEMKEQLGDPDEIGKTHNQLGLIYWERANYPESITNLQQAIETATRVGDKELEGSARNNLGLVFDEQGEYTQSIEQYQRALDLHRATHFERGEGDVLGNIGGVYLLLGQVKRALPYYQQALAISERLGLKPASSDDLGNIASCLAGLGDIDGALKTFDRALQLAHETGLTKEEADWRKGKGSALLGLGRFDAALSEFAAAEQVYEHAGLKRELVEALSDTAQVYGLLGDVHAARERFERAFRVATEIGNGSGESASLLALGDLERREKNYVSADSRFKEALQKARATGEENNVVSALLYRATNDLDRKHYDSALPNVSEALQHAEESQNVPAIALAHYVLGEVRRSQGGFPESLEEYSAAEKINERLRDPELAWRISYGRGQTFATEGKTQDAVDAYKDAVRIIEETRAGIVEEQYQAGYIEDRYQVYVALVELLLKLHKPDQAFSYSEKLRSRAYLDRVGSEASRETTGAAPQMRELAERIRRLRLALAKEYAVGQKERRENALELFSAELAKAEREYQELLNYTDPAAAHEYSAGLLSANVIHQLLPRDAALVEYVVGKRMLSILLITPSAIIGVPVPIKSENLSSRTELLRSLILEKRPEWTAPARGLHKVLLEPIEARLTSIRQLWIVPDGILNYLPFTALSGINDRTLGDQFTVAYLPAAAALTQRVELRGSGRLLAMAPTDSGLPNAPVEAHQIARIFGSKSKVIIGNAATKTLFKQIAGDYEYLHLATHSSLNRNAPLLSAIELSPDSDNDGRLELYEIAGMELHARLVTLSACETALGKGYFSEIPAGDEFVGLTRAFLGAGDQTVLASLWAVNDESTRLLMLSFYRHLRATTAAEALALAQREVRSDARFAHPYYWAPFVVVGTEIKNGELRKVSVYSDKEH